VAIRLPTVTPPTILVATGDNAMRALIEQQVASRGYRSVACTHGEEAMESVRRELPDVMLLDLFMPIMDGEEVILQMRSNESYRRTPIVVVTGSVLVDRGKHEILEGFGIPLMQKPWSEDELFDRIEGALIGRSAGRNAILPKEKG
jgi:CheY-like chemotaxis protein